MSMFKIKASFIALVFFTIYAYCPAWASVREVTLFPDSAHVWEETSALIEKHNHRQMTKLTLPAQADPQTLSISLEDDGLVSVTDITWEKVDPPEVHLVSELKYKLDELYQRRTSLEILIKSAQKSAAFWENQAGFQAPDISAMNEIAEIIFSNLQNTYSSIHETRQKLEKLESEIIQLEKRIEQITGPQNKVWKVTVFLDTPGHDHHVDISYSYVLRNSGWNSFYRLEAFPGKEQLLFTWQAEIWQSSGMDWDNVLMTLATLEPQMELLPRPVPPWVVAPRKEIPVTRALQPGKSMEMMDVQSMRSGFEPVLERTGTYSQWKLGTRSLAAGERARFKIQEEVWPADFTHLIRPSVGNKAFIRAHAEFQQARDLPRGEAIFILDGTLLGKRPLMLAGTEQTFFFGLDPFVHSEVVVREKKTGARGILSGRQTYLLDLVINLENNQIYPVKVRLEEPRPVLRDQRISASYNLNPQPDNQTEELFIWNISLEPGERSQTKVIISMEAPSDMDIDWGWR